jgi:ribosomal protein S18 acetylase RimI-like enzyme
MIAAQAATASSHDRHESSVSIMPMHREHVKEVVDVHLASFPGFFLTFLGPRFLRLLYSGIVETPDHVALVAQSDAGPLVGFVAGVTRQSDFYARLAQRRRFAFAAAALRTAIRHPRTIPRLFRALGIARASQAAAAQALLMSIAVAPDMQHCGIGRRLLTSFLAAMKQKRVPAVSLTTGRDENEYVNGFYQQSGFQIARVYVTPEGRWMNEYVIDLSTWSPPSHTSRSHRLGKVS